MTLTEQITFIGEAAARTVTAANYAESTAGYASLAPAAREKAAMLITVENTLRGIDSRYPLVAAPYPSQVAQD
jgi:hypothetical protein